MIVMRIKLHIPEGEDGFTLPSFESSVSFTISLLHSLPALSLAALITEAGFHAFSKEGEHLRIFKWGAGTGLFNLTSSSVLPNDSIITSPGKDVLFTSFSETTNSFVSSVPSPSPDTFFLSSLAGGFYTCGKKRADEEENVMILGSGTVVFNLTSSY